MISILIVDTDKVTRDILLKLLNFELPHVVFHITARSESAFELCKTLSINILVTATSVPPTESDAMMEAIRTLGPDPIKIIIMTSESREEELERLTRFPNTCVICKPIIITELINLISEKIVEIEARTTVNV